MFQNYKKKCSIIIPVYNSCDRLRSTFESLSKANLNNDIEIVVVDNCSEDNIQDLVLKSGLNINYYRNEKNLGRVGNWNKALSMANGEWIFFLFAGDEVYSKFSLYDAIENLEDNHCQLGVYRTIIKSNNKLRFQNKWFVYNDMVCSSSQTIKKYLSLGLMQWGPLQSYLFQRSLLANTKFNQNNATHADVDFILKVLSSSSKIFISCLPSVVWTQFSDRFHSKMNLSMVMVDDLKFIDYWSQQLRIPLHFLPIKAIVVARLFWMSRYYSIGQVFKAIYGVLKYKKSSVLKF